MTWLLGIIKGGALWAGAAFIAVAIFLIRKAGADAERLKVAQADVRAAREVQKARTKAHGASDAELNKGVDKWTRK